MAKRLANHPQRDASVTPDQDRRTALPSYREALQFAPLAPADGKTKAPVREITCRPETLTAKMLDALKPAPAGHRLIVPDSGAVRGFVLRLNDDGGKTFSLRYRFNGEQRRVSFGAYPAVKLTDAHDAAKAVLSEVGHGRDPNGAAKPAPQVPTARAVKDVVDKFVAEYLGEHDRRSGREMEQMLRRDLLPRLGDRDIKTVGQDDIEDVLAAVRDRARKRARNRVLNKATGAVYARAAAEERRRAAEQGHAPDFRAAHRAAKAGADAAREAAKDAADQEAKRAGVSSNRVHAVIRKVWNWAREEKRYVTDNPAKFKPKVEERPRDRLLSDDEIRAVWNACGEVHPIFADIVRLLMMSGQRLSEIAKLTWEEFNEETGELRLSGGRTKNRKGHIVPLSDTARTIIANRDKIDGCPFIFSTTGKSPVSGFSKWKAELDERLGFQVPWHVHDLRHVAASGMAELEIEPHVIEAVLNHASGVVSGIAGRYNTYSYLKEKRAALARWGAHLERIVAPPAVGKVVNLRAPAHSVAPTVADA